MAGRFARRGWECCCWTQALTPALKTTLQVFVANPNKSRPVVEVLVNNKDKLLTYLRDFHTDKGKPAATPAALPAAQPP